MAADIVFTVDDGAPLCEDRKPETIAKILAHLATLPVGSLISIHGLASAIGCADQTVTNLAHHPALSDHTTLARHNGRMRRWFASRETIAARKRRADG